MAENGDREGSLLPDEFELEEPSIDIDLPPPLPRTPTGLPGITTDLRLERIEDLLRRHILQDRERGRLVKKVLVKLLSERVGYMTESKCNEMRKHDHPQRKPIVEILSTWMGTVLQLGAVLALVWLGFKFAAREAIATPTSAPAVVAPHQHVYQPPIPYPGLPTPVVGSKLDAAPDPARFPRNKRTSKR